MVTPLRSGELPIQLRLTALVPARRCEGIRGRDAENADSAENADDVENADNVENADDVGDANGVDPGVPREKQSRWKVTASEEEEG